MCLKISKNNKPRGGFDPIAHWPLLRSPPEHGGAVTPAFNNTNQFFGLVSANTQHFEQDGPPSAHIGRPAAAALEPEPPHSQLPPPERKACGFSVFSFSSHQFGTKARQNETAPTFSNGTPWILTQKGCEIL